MNITSLKSSISIILFVSLLVVSCDTSNDPCQNDFSDVPDPFSIENPVSVDTTESGLIIYVIEEGTGDLEAGPRDQISFYYTKRYKNDLSRIIASSYANGVTFPETSPVTPTNSSSVISESQFREGVIGMVEGEKRVLILTPPIIGYLGNSYTYSSDTLWIDIELEGITL